MQEDLIQLCLGGYRQATLKNYNFAWGVWAKFLHETNTDVSVYANVENSEKGFVTFLQWMMKKGVFSTALFLLVRSAVSSLFRIVFSGKEFGTLYPARLLARNIRKEKPRMAKHKEVFDITLLLNQYRRMGDNTDLRDSELRGKVATMLMLYIMLRPVDMLRMDMSAMIEVEGGLHFSAVIKNAPEYSECVLSRVAEKVICPVDAVMELWHRVQDHMGDTKGKGLFFDDLFTQPLNKYNLERDMKLIMFFAGIPNHFTPYSIKHASMTYRIASGVDEKWINRNARLSQRTNTAVRHYFIGQACKETSRVIAMAPTSLPTSENASPTRMLFPSLPVNIPSQQFDLSPECLTGLTTPPSERVQRQEDPFLFKDVCSVLTVSFLSERWSSPQGCGVCSGCGREQLLECTCSPHVGSMSHAPDSPPKTPIPALSM
jgi:hypothetical protein